MSRILENLIHLGVSKTVNQWDSRTVFVLSHCLTVPLKDSMVISAALY